MPTGDLRSITRAGQETCPQLAARKGGDPIVSLTSYHAHTAAIVYKYADFILVGDSLGMVMHGMETTVGVPLDLMIMHGKAVVRGTQRALIVVDMPFGTYEESPNMAFRNNRDLTFSEVGSDWGFDSQQVTHGLAQVDLDLDEYW